MIPPLWLTPSQPINTSGTDAPLVELSPSNKRVRGFFAHYPAWVAVQSGWLDYFKVGSYARITLGGRPFPGYLKVEVKP